VAFLSARLLKAAGRLKPVLTKIFPISLLRRAKALLINHAVSQTNFIPFERAAHPDGINLIGDIRAEIGLGQSCRLVADALSASGLDFAIYHFDQLRSPRHDDHSWDQKISNETPYNINLFHINAADLPLAFFELGPAMWHKRYNIGYWLWELENFPPEWRTNLEFVDEIWTPSEFVSSAVRRVTDKPVHTIPYPVSAPAATQYDRESFGLPDSKFLFLCMYDCSSTMERKNPLGAVSAFTAAFRPEQTDVGLVVKINNPLEQDILLLKRELAGYSHVYFFMETFSKERVNSLIACADAYISLHRSEGFGLILAEAMLLGTPTIATNWSANTEFMNAEVACMVDYSFTAIQNDAAVYKKGERWAEPDIRQAAEYMRRLHRDGAYRAKLAAAAQKHVQSELSAARARERIRRRVEEIYASRH
jgi:glycosyltransferase involved in cell wall biosynthesis